MKLRTLFFVFSLMLGPWLGANAQIDPARLASFCDSLMNYGAEYPMIPGGVLSISSRDSVYLVKGYGYSNFDERITVDPDSTLFQLGSVGKLMTAIAVLQQVEPGLVALNENVNSYLLNWQLNNPYPENITVSNLLTHTAGFDDRVIGYMARSSDEVQPLEEHLTSNLPSLFQAPGKSINYSNYSYALAGHIVEVTSGRDFKDYVSRRIFDTLEMRSSTYYLPDDYNKKKEFALGYRWREDFEEVKSYPRHATPAGSLISTGADMTKFTQALLNEDSRILSPKSFFYLFTQQATNHDLLTGYTIGMEVQNFNGVDAIAKGGNVPGFISALVLLPREKVGIFLAVNTQTDNFLELFFDSVLKEFYPREPAEEPIAILTDIDEYTGVYINERSNHHTIEEMFALFEGQFSINESDSGNLTCYHNGEWQEYVQVKQDIFQNTRNPYQHIVFKRGPDGDVNEMYRNYVLGGIQVPASYRKAGWFERPRFLNDEYPFALMILVSYLLLPIGWLVLKFMRKSRPDLLASSKIPFHYHAAAFLFLVLFLWNVIGFWLPLLKDRQSLFFDFDMSLYQMRYFNFAMAGTAVVLVLLALKLWISKQGTWWIRLYYSLFGLIAVSYILILERWHFLSIVYK